MKEDIVEWIEIFLLLLALIGIITICYVL